MKAALCFLTGALCLFTPFRTIASVGSIYGDTDAREEISQISDPRIANLSHAVVLITDNEWVKEIAHSGNFKADPLNTDIPDENEGKPDLRRFANQTMTGFCTGFLIDPTHVMTAGHCIDEGETCDTLKFVFDYVVPAEDTNVTDRTLSPVIPAEHIKKCNSIVTVSQFPLAHADYAIIELVEPQNDRPHFHLATETSKPLPGRKVAMLGHPNGKQMKFTAGAAQVLLDHNPGQDAMMVQDSQFVTNLDAFSGNSGSPVFDAETLDVLGILVEGAEDMFSPEDCSLTDQHYPMIPTPNQINSFDGMVGERVTAISSIMGDVTKSLSDSMSLTATPPQLH